ncbi:alpha/beta fold hydrolase [Saccharothrix sp. AJ9571]|nr:alpha/beta fold hydrolase [Saccharothrix sp. AJ9571]
MSPHEPGRPPHLAERAVRTLTTAAREHVVVSMLGIPRLLRHPIWRAADPRQGSGRGVLLVPGFAAHDHSLALTAAWLRARGYRTTGAAIGLNAGCTTELVERIERRLETHVAATGGRVVLLGQSRGGTLARLAAARRPELVRAVVMLGSPVVDPLGAQPDVLRFARFLARLSAVGVPGLLDQDCFTGDCFRDNLTALADPLPGDVPVLSFYSRSDGIVPWRSSLDPHAECVEVHSTHTGMAFDPAFYTELEPRLAQWAAAGTDRHEQLDHAC